MSLSEAHNKAVVARLYTEANDAQRYDVLDEICQPGVVIHDPLTGDQRGVEGLKGLLAFFRQAFPEQHTELSQLVAEGDYVAVLHAHHVVHGGPFNGLPPTGRSLVVPGHELYRLEDGRIAELWRFDADLSMMIQLGAVPAPAAG